MSTSVGASSNSRTAESTPIIRRGGEAGYSADLGAPDDRGCCGGGGKSSLLRITLRRGVTAASSKPNTTEPWPEPVGLFLTSANFGLGRPEEEAASATEDGVALALPRDARCCDCRWHLPSATLAPSFACVRTGEASRPLLSSLTRGGERPDFSVRRRIVFPSTSLVPSSSFFFSPFALVSLPKSASESALSLVATAAGAEGAP
mmetsp:Transcript_50059/g.150641  ORF Transcript_50059/g.150641 Transcript_50059/m.150641 type:complete len:204 (+) Transcript_50059:1063-1674(+)